MGVDRPSRSSEDDDRSRRPERRQSDQKPPEGEPARLSRSEMRAARKRKLVELGKAEEMAKQGSTGAGDTSGERSGRDEASAKSYLERRQDRVEAYERGELPRSQLSGSERRFATKREFERRVAEIKESEKSTATDRPRSRGPEPTLPSERVEQHNRRVAEREAAKAEREQRRARFDTAPTGGAGDSGPDQPRTRRELAESRRLETAEEADARIEAVSAPNTKP